MPVTQRRIEEALEVFERHRTVRNYTPDKVPEADVAKIIEAGRHAPSDATGFMYSVIRVRDAAKRAKIQALTGGNPHITEASEFFVICMDLHRQGRMLRHLGVVPAPRGIWSLIFGITDAVLVAENMAVAAEALGYGTGFIGGIQKDATGVVKVLALPGGVFPIVGLTMGAIDRFPEPRKRLPLAATFHEDMYHYMSEEELLACFEAMKSETGKFDWTATLKKYFAEGGEMDTREEAIRKGFADQGFPL